MLKQLEDGSITSLEANKTIKDIRNISSEIRSIKENSYLSNSNSHKISMTYEDNNEVEIFSILGTIYLHDLTTSKIFELDIKKKTSRAATMPQTLDYEKIQISTGLIETIKKVLGTKEIYF